MNLLQTIQTLASSAAGLAIVGLSIVVLHHIDLRHGRLFTASSWVLCAYAGGWIALVPWLQGQALPLTWASLAVLLSIAGWFSRAEVIWMASRPTERSTRWAAIAAVFLASSAAAFVPSLTWPGKAEEAIRPSSPPPLETHHAKVD